MLRVKTRACGEKTKSLPDKTIIVTKEMQAEKIIVTKEMPAEKIIMTKDTMPAEKMMKQKMDPRTRRSLDRPFRTFMFKNCSTSRRATPGLLKGRKPSWRK